MDSFFFQRCLSLDILGKYGDIVYILGLQTIDKHLSSFHIISLTVIMTVRNLLGKKYTIIYQKNTLLLKFGQSYLIDFIFFDRNRKMQSSLLFSFI